MLRLDKWVCPLKCVDAYQIVDLYKSTFTLCMKNVVEYIHKTCYKEWILCIKKTGVLLFYSVLGFVTILIVHDATNQIYIISKYCCITM